LPRPDSTLTLSFHLVQKLRAGQYLRDEIIEPAYSDRKTPSALDKYAHKLSAWLKTEATRSRKQRRSLKQIHAELRELGFEGSYDRVAAFARQWKVGQMERVNSASKGTVILIHGCFWHRHECKKGLSKPGTNREFWEKKLADNIQRDERNETELKKLGWEVLIIWECQTKSEQELSSQLIQFLEEDDNYTALDKA
jgi:DNA mismatch endonuclease Vsr